MKTYFLHIFKAIVFPSVRLTVKNKKRKYFCYLVMTFIINISVEIYSQNDSDAKTSFAASDWLIGRTMFFHQWEVIVRETTSLLGANTGKSSFYFRDVRKVWGHRFGWLMIAAIYGFIQRGILTFKAIHGLAPKYIIELINIKPRSIYNLRSNQSLLLDPPKGKMLVTLGDRSFSAAAPYLWNSLPAELRDIQSLAIFKCKLKTYLFRAAFTT